MWAPAGFNRNSQHAERAFLGRGLSWKFLSLKFVSIPHNKKQDECYDQEVDNIVEKKPVINCSNLSSLRFL